MSSPSRSKLVHVHGVTFGVGAVIRACRNKAPPAAEVVEIKRRVSAGLALDELTGQ